MAIGSVAAILGGLILGAGHGLAQRELNQKRASEDFERQVMGKALLEAITSGNFTPEMRDSFKRFYGGKNSEAFAQIAEIMSSGIRQGQEEAIRRQAEFVREQMNRYRPEPPPEAGMEMPQPGAAAAPTAPLALPPILPPQAPTGVTPGASSGIGVAPPGRTFTIPVPTPQEGIGAAPVPMPPPPPGLALPGRQAPMPEPPAGLAVPGPPPAPMPEGRVAQVPMQPAPPTAAPLAAAPPAIAPAPDIQQQYARQLRLIGGRQPGEPAPGSKATFSMVKGVSETIEARSTNDQGLDMLKATGRMPNLRVSTFLDAMASAGATLPEGRLEKWTDLRVQRTYQEELARAKETGLRGAAAEREAAQNAMRFHGVPGGLKKELLYTDQAAEDQDATTFVRERWATNQGNIVEAMTAARRAGFVFSPPAEKALREGIYNDVKAARYAENAQSGKFGSPADAMADAVRVATIASGYGGNASDTALGFPVPPELSKELEEVARERYGKSTRELTQEQIRAARAQVKAEKPPQIAAETAARTTAERIVSQTAAGVPERATAEERKEYSALAANIAGLRNLIGKLSDPEVQKVMGPLLSTQPWGALRRGAGAFAPGALSEDQRKFLAQLPEIIAPIRTKLIGAAQTSQEAANLIPLLPTEKDFGVGALAKLKALVEGMERNRDAIVSALIQSAVTPPGPGGPAAAPAAPAPAKPSAGPSQTDPLGVLKRR